MDSSTQDSPPRDAIAMPPRTTKGDGGTRRCGVEIEFASLPLERAAGITTGLFGGVAEKTAPFRIDITGTRLGDFTAELDSQYVHPKKNGANPLVDAVTETLAEFVGEITKSVVPSEITCPPVPITQLGDIADLIDAMARAGALGTSDSVLYAFGLQLNPEASGLDTETLVPVLRAYMLLSDALRAEIRVDSLRALLPFADPFPLSYRCRVATPGYAPDRTTLIDDFLRENATRNRELDLLPLFAHIDESRVRKAIDDPLIKPRPAFHYRLPNARFESGGAHLIREWNRWVAVERLAADEDALDRLAGEFMDATARTFDAEAWAARTREWLAP